MKTKEKPDKTLIEDLREIRDKISLDIKDMTLDQIKNYLKEKKTLHPTQVWSK
jgi:hypothetical protein